MKKWLSVTAIVILCLALVVGIACGGGGEEEEEGVKEVKFGWGLPMTGIYGAVFLPSKQALELANEYIGEFTVAGEKYKWDLIFEDNGWTGAGGVASATKLIFEDGVNIMTQLGAESALAVQTICEEAGVIFFAGGLALDALGPDKPHTFYGQTVGYANMAAFFKYVSEAYPEVKTASMVNEDTANGHEMATQAAGAADYYGIEWLGAEFYPPGTKEFYPMATRMASKNPDLCYADLRNLQPMQEMGWEGISFFFMWGSGNSDQYGWETVQGYLVYYPAPFGEALPESLRPMAAEYEDRFGIEFGQLAYHYVMQLYWVTDALKKAGTVDDVDQIMATLETETLDTPMGPIKYGLSEIDGIGHLPIMPCWVGEIRDGEYHLVFEMSADEAEALTREIFGK